MEPLFSIGKISKICNVSTSTLRYYDKIGLLCPIQKNTASGYRFYHYEHITKLMSIQTLRKLDFSIPQIQDILASSCVENQLNLIEQKYQFKLLELEKLENQIHTLKAKKELLQNQFHNIKTGKYNYFSISIKQLERRYVFTIRKKPPLPGLNGYIIHFTELTKELANYNHSFTSMLLIHHHLTPVHSFEADCIPQRSRDISFGFLNHKPMQTPYTIELEEGCYLSALTKGMAGSEKFPVIYNHITHWLKTNGYRSAGPMIDLIHTDISQLKAGRIPTDILSEIQIKIERTVLS